MKLDLLKNELLLITKGDLIIVNKILEKAKEQDEDFVDALIKVLKAENSSSYFSQNHFEETKKDKDFFDYNISKEMSLILGLIYPKLDIVDRQENIVSNDLESEEIFNSLEKNGYFVFPNLLSEKYVLEIKNGIKNCSFIKNPPTPILYKIKSEEDLLKIDTNTLWVFDNQKVLDIPVVQQILQDYNVLSAIEKYLGCQPIHVSCTTWWSKFNKLDDISLNYGAQLFHQDKEFIKFVKIFIYLTDVNDNNGPHEYISGSHKDYTNNTPEGYKMSQRLTDEYLESKYPNTKFKSFTGKAGTVLITDSNGFHKGKPLLEGSRLLLQLEFASSLYFNDLPSFSDTNLTNSYKEFLLKNSRFGLNYNTKKYNVDLKIKNLKRINYLVESINRNIRLIAKKAFKK